MKRLAMVLAVAFTMGLASSAVTAATAKDDAKKKECSNSGCSSAKKTEKK